MAARTGLQESADELVIVQRLDRIGERLNRCTEMVRELIVDLSE